MKTIDSVEVTLNNSQADIQVINANTTYCLWPRGGGKTSGGIAPRILRLDQKMPRSQILIVSDTYERLENRVIPNIMNFFIEKMGLIEGIDFVKYKRPPDNWTKPLVPLDKFDKVISFPSGMALCLVSLAVEGSANAYNAQAAIFDEAKFLKENDINTEVIPALRGSEKEYGHLPEYLSKWFFTDKYGGNIEWLLDKRKLVNKEAVEIIRNLQMEIYRLQQDQKENRDNHTDEYRLKNLIDPIEAKLNRIRKHLIYVSDMKPYENKAVLGEFYFKSQKRTCKPHEFDIAILNMDPDKAEQSYYPTYTKKNKHTTADYNPNEPLIFAMDYNYRICPMPIVQYNERGTNLYKTVNCINYIYQEFPKGIDDTIKLFSEKYKDHRNRDIHYIYDHTAIGRSPLKTTFKDTVIANLINYGWNVIEHYTGDAPDHDIKHEFLKKIFDTVGERSVSTNEITCEWLIKSIENSPAMIVGGVTKKDKRTEKDPNYPALKSTHGSDAFDQLLWGLFEWEIINKLNTVAIEMIAR